MDLSRTDKTAVAVPEKLTELISREKGRVEGILKEQLFREYILGSSNVENAFRTFCAVFSADASQKVRAVLLCPTDKPQYEDLFLIKNTAWECFGDEKALCCTAVGEWVLIITSITDVKKLTEAVAELQQISEKYFGMELKAVYSAILRLDETGQAYERLKKCIGYTFYSSGKNMLSEENRVSENAVRISVNYSDIEDAVKCGNIIRTETCISDFFTKLSALMPPPAIAKTYCLELYVCIIRCCNIGDIDKYMKGIVTVQEAKTLVETRKYISGKAIEIAKKNAPENIMVYSPLVEETIHIIEHDMGSETLSLRWIARTILYTNVDYLGKLFKKEVGMNFSHYVMEKRMEKAKHLILDGHYDKIYEVAEKVGYGSNSQYFSQVFKKYTGVSPLEYKECAKALRADAV